jgi:predicted glycoside hydrolase/deacetylase ChbG (UPF0249 family)
VNADDYGLTSGVNRGIQDAYLAGGVTSATLMATAPQAHHAAKFASENPRLGVGCHVVLVDGSPVSGPAKVSSLLEPGTPSFYATPGRFLIALLSGRVKSEHLVCEVGEQLQRIRALGIPPTHVDTHKHLHVFPAVARALMTAARQHGITAIRNPFESTWAVSASKGAGLLRKTEVSGLRQMYARRFLKMAEENEFVTTDGAIGVSATGTLDSVTLERLLRTMPEGTWELVCHPGYADSELQGVKTRLRESRDIEASALRELPNMLPKNVELINFAELRA